MTLTENELHDLATRALTGLGLSPTDAGDAARILVLGDLFGVHTHGVSRLESYGERLRVGGINPKAEIRMERVAPAIVKIDGDNAVGTLVGYRALESAMQVAREFGIGVAFARNSNHFGAIAPYSLIAAEAGFASIIGSNSSTTIAPTGGREAKVGNSPVAFGIPNPEGRPMILDMAVSVVARAKIRDALKRGEPIPDTWATDKEGRPTTDPKAALDGFLLPIGGYKGYGLALIVDLFAGLLSGAAYLTHVTSWVDEPEAPQNLGHFFILIDTRSLGPSTWLAERMQDFVGILHSTTPADAQKPVLVPGEQQMNKLERHRRDGIPIEAALREKLEAFAART
jgi:LDH2 family malate/lactate/ureidoglycolate dehydrogenase